tara:strand:+ start:394 stop:504 length:111 start_codon:yes stop_codon:yes gene_type:complete
VRALPPLWLPLLWLLLRAARMRRFFGLCERSMNSMT